MQKASVKDERIVGPKHSGKVGYAGWAIGLTFFIGLAAGALLLFAAVIVAKRRQKVDNFYHGALSRALNEASPPWPLATDG
jgi:Ni/Fe-hydrogenase subunit HybB-like protein